ncbi:hypothetical protein AC579_820 [Pseudocercospora musae]|uniref:SH3 domain-containing protein n=1 Tax=Pseudocercospora musae TaxID=113226 RepID=A0A139IC16_9PEZI|nr:hypothetical protein AC579_820 [Pseudocercospora musae]
MTLTSDLTRACLASARADGEVEVAVARTCKSRCFPTRVTRLQQQHLHHQRHHRTSPHIEACQHTATPLCSAREEKLSGTTQLQHQHGISSELGAFRRLKRGMGMSLSLSMSMSSRKGADGRANANATASANARRPSSAHHHPPHSLSAHLEPTSTCTSYRRSERRKRSSAKTLCALLASTIPTAMAQNCLSLADSTACPAFSAASISTDTNLTGLFPFLQNVSDTASFDTAIQNYIAGDFTQLRYQQLIGCSDVDLDNTTHYYARYTTSVLCNAIVQNSIDACGLTGDATRPLCADSCAEYAQSEQQITASNICGTAGNNALTQIRADFTNCALPATSITRSCIEAVENQPDNCGFTENLSGLCSYCAASSPNATDSCCLFSNTTDRCDGVTLPIIASASLQPVTVTASATGTPTAGAARQSSVGSNNDGLSGGQIAGIVVGSILGALLILAAIIAGCLLLRRHRDSSPATSVFNQPSTGRSPQMTFNDGTRDAQERAGLAVLPGGRVARMSALEGSSSSDHNVPYAMGYTKDMPEDDAPEQLAPPPKRSGSLSSGSQLAIGAAGVADTSPSSGAEYTSPESQGQSEQLNFFKDYYSQDEIRPGDLVATLWAYEPRAADEFQLERGDMIKVIGIWDDGWATGVRVRQRADDWRPEDKVARDSGLSEAPPQDHTDEGEVKAFPLVCVCLPQHWKKTIEGDSTDGTGPQNPFPDPRG